ncbi:hypothetical protein D3C76_912460 [compost metagenome]
MNEQVTSAEHDMTGILGWSNQASRTAILKHIAYSLLRISWINGQISCPRLQYCKHSGNCIRCSVRNNAHYMPSSNTKLCKLRGEPISSVVQFTIAPSFFTTDQCCSIRCKIDLILKELCHRLIDRKLTFIRMELLQ